MKTFTNKPFGTVGDTELENKIRRFNDSKKKGRSDNPRTPAVYIAPRWFQRLTFWFFDGLKKCGL